MYSCDPRCSKRKTSAMLICPRSNGVSKAVAGGSSLANITCDGKRIPLVSDTRLLGVIVDSNLSWKDHVDQVCLKVNLKIGALRRSFRQLTPTARRAFFLSVKQQDLEYAASAIVPSMAVSQNNSLLAAWLHAFPCDSGARLDAPCGFYDRVCYQKYTHRQHLATLEESARGDSEGDRNHW